MIISSLLSKYIAGSNKSKNLQDNEQFNSNSDCRIKKKRSSKGLEGIIGNGWVLYCLSKHKEFLPFLQDLQTKFFEEAEEWGDLTKILFVMT